MKDKLEELREEITELKTKLAEMQTINADLRDQVHWAMRRLRQYETGDLPRRRNTHRPTEEEPT
jgi:cell division protein FtsL